MRLLWRFIAALRVLPNKSLPIYKICCCTRGLIMVSCKRGAFVMKSASYISLKNAYPLFCAPLSRRFFSAVKRQLRLPLQPAMLTMPLFRPGSGGNTRANGVPLPAVSSQAGIGTAFAISMPNGGGTALGETDGVKLVTHTVFYPEAR